MSGATVAEASPGAGAPGIQRGTLRTLRFHRARSVTIPARQTAASDAATLPVTPLESLTISLYFAGPTGPSTFHEDGLTTTYRAHGDHRADLAGGAFAEPTSHSYYYLDGVDVTGGRRGTVVAFGDSSATATTPPWAPAHGIRTCWPSGWPRRTSRWAWPTRASPGTCC